MSSTDRIRALDVAALLGAQAPLSSKEREVTARVVSGRRRKRVGYEPGTDAPGHPQNTGSDERQRGLTARFEERVRERERIARELHDTLLQSTQALLLAVQAMSTRIAPDDAMYSMLADTLRRADAVMAQGRDRIRNLRTATGASVDLRRSLSDAWKDLGGRIELRILVEGKTRDLAPDAGDEISLIGREALINALRHSRAKVIEAQILFSDEQLRMSIRDDGVGLPQRVVAADSSSGHWGLAGMRERAQRITANLGIWSAPGVGTEIELTVPAASAYRPRAAQHGSESHDLLAGNGRQAATS